MTDLTPEAHAQRAAQYLACARLWRRIERDTPYLRTQARSMRRDYVRMAWDQRRLGRLLRACPGCGRPMVVLVEGAACVDCEPARGGA